MKNLRPYQIEIIDNIKKSYRKGFVSPCVVLTCGGGKSVIAAEISKRTTDKGNRVLFLVHRLELCQQIYDTFDWWGVNMNLCTIGMVQTITKRLAKIQPPTLIITDEHHHSTAKTYKRIYEYFPKAKRIGFTATPIRLNGDGLDKVSDDLITSVSAQWLINNNFLCDYKYFTRPLVDTTKLKEKHGEFDITESNSIMAQNVVYGQTVDNYIKIANGKKAIAYCTSVEASRNTANQFMQNGIPAAHIDGKTPKTERKQIMDNFRSGKILVLTSCEIVSEGIDIADCECCILLRPTKSLSLYIQQAMRCLRYKKDKEAIIIDHVDNIRLHGSPTATREWTLTGFKEPELCVECGRSTFKNDLKASTEHMIFKRDNCHNYFTCTEKKNCVGSCIKLCKILKCPYCDAIMNIYPDKQKFDEPEERNNEKELIDCELEELSKNELDLIDKSLGFWDYKKCKTKEELQEFAKKKGYKEGFVYYKSLELGL